MAVLNPPPMQIPGALVKDKEMAGFFDALIRTVYQIWTEVFSISFKEKTLTTDATVTALQRIAVPNNQSVYIEAIVIARRTGGSAGTAGDTAFYKRCGCFKNIAGTLSQVGSTVADTGEDQAGWDCSFASSGTNIVLTATGAINNNITWESSVSFYEVGA